MIWLLRVEIAGRTWYLASRACEPERGGVELAHHGALSVGSWSEALDTTGGSIIGTCTMDATIHVGDLEGWTLARDGQRLDGAVAEVALWEPGTSYAAREVLLRGYVSSGGDVPRDGDPLAITIAGALVEDAASWPDPDDVTSDDAWPSIPADSDDYDQRDIAYPMPIGELGVYTTRTGSIERTSTVKIVIVDTTGGAEVGVVAGAPMVDTTIRIWNDVDKDTADLPVSTTEDGDGVLRATVSFATAPAGWVFDGSENFYATDIDAGVVGDFGARSPSTLWEVALYLLLRRYGEIGLDGVDVGGWWGLGDQLAGWLLGLLPDPADPLQIVSDELLPLCPALSIVPGPRGQRPVYLAADGYGRRLIVGRDLFVRADPAVYVDVQLCNRMVVSYAPSAARGDFRGRIMIGPNRHPDGAVSEADHGLQAESIESSATYARGTAGLAASEHVRMRHKRRLLLTYDAPLDVAFVLALGDRIRLVDEDRDLADRYAWVVGREIDGAAELCVVGLLLT